jgi:hypothetical protein
MIAEPIGCTASLEEQEVFDFEIFPNPASESFKLRTPSDRQVEITINDLQGKQVYHTHARGAYFEIATYELASGAYVLRVNDSVTTHTKRLIIQH